MYKKDTVSWFELVIFDIIMFIAMGILAIYVYTLKAPTEYTYYDIELIKAHIMDEIHMPPEEIERLDASKDGKIDSLDYVMIINILEEE